MEPDEAWYVGGFVLSSDVTALQIQAELQRVSGILLIIGLLHGLNIVLMPVPHRRRP